jgi:hypothetical protein
MKRYKIHFFITGIVLCLFLFTPGCQKPVQLVLKAKPGQIDTYRLKTVSQRKVSIEGPQPENRPPLEGGQTTDRIEMVFDQQVQNIEASGNAIEKITIKELKYFGEIRDKPVVDFNSEKDKDPNNALFALVGQSYTIEVTPSGKVSKIIDANNARAAIKKISSNNAIAGGLLEDKTIEKRHFIPLPDEKHNKLKTGDKWSDIVSIDFGRMGIRAYERTYILDKIEKTGANEIAFISLSAIPSILDANDSRRTTETVPPMTDIRQTYTGMMKFDITSGILQQYEENLKNEWIIVPPGTGQSGAPIVFNMTAIQSYDIEKLK